ncbi:pyridoxamine 5'-phosphate oxidase family protein [Yoonia sp. R2331]|uniref:pyridoxamine 5'-phosphate oxidase family protein n=1 Tax=Yoonia sp. R2331 TaxID=3237238 RepID=UPI0034E4BC93
MARQTETKDDAIDQLWRQLEQSRIVMLSVPDSGQHPQPMSHFAHRKDGAIWFITSADTDLAMAVGAGADGMLTLATSSEDYQASLKGRLSFETDPDKLDEIWTPLAGAWFENGRQDPKIRLLKFVPSEAAVWASETNAILLGLKLLRANMTEGGAAPDVGVHHVFRFQDAA